MKNKCLALEKGALEKGAGVQIDLVTLLIVIIYLLGFVTALSAVREARTSQGAIAWALSLIQFPYVAVPLYWVFGRRRFHGYVRALRKARLSRDDVSPGLAESPAAHALAPDFIRPELKSVLEHLSDVPFTKGNDAELLINGQDTFNSIFAAMQTAKKYLLTQFYIIRDDAHGRELQRCLIERAKAGIQVYLLYDEIGSVQLPSSYLDTLIAAGVKVSGFKTTKGRANRFQINFRNHRKLVLIDGEHAYVGGHNVGDEYLGRSRRFGVWRDTHIRLAGPAVKGLQLTFLRDWHWATGERPALSWEVHLPLPGKFDALTVPTGPEDEMEQCSMLFVHLINAAKKRCWVATPYFVPDESVTTALKLAAIRGVDVRILLPERPDHKLIYLAAYSYVSTFIRSKVRLFKYQSGFMHQKVILIDDDTAAVGTANLDNRSFRLNFEMTVVVSGPEFAAKVASMLEKDFAQSRELTTDDYEKRSFLFRLGVDISRLFAPIL